MTPLPGLPKKKKKVIILKRLLLKLSHDKVEVTMKFWHGIRRGRSRLLILA